MANDDEEEGHNGKNEIQNEAAKGTSHSISLASGTIPDAAALSNLGSSDIFVEQPPNNNNDYDDAALYAFNSNKASRNSSDNFSDEFLDEHKPNNNNIHLAMPPSYNSIQHPSPQNKEEPPIIEEATTKPLPSGLKQTYALLIKNLLYRIRTPLPTFFEIFGSSLMMLLLVAGYSLSTIKYRNAAIYSGWDLDLPGPWLELVRRATGLEEPSGEIKVEAGRKLDLLREKGRIWKEEYERIFGDVGGGGILDLDLEEKKLEGMKEVHHFWRSLQDTTDEEEEEGDGVSQEEEEDSEEENGQPFGGFTPSGDGDGVLDLINDARSQFDQILKSPIPIPTFTQYITVAEALSSSITNADEITKILSDSNYGRKFGNLLTLGTLHITPKSNPITASFVNYLEAYHRSDALDKLKIRMHEEQREAIQFIDDNLNERTWALIDFGKTGLMGDDGGPSMIMGDDVDGDALLYTGVNDFNYTIRMNYTTLPNTNQITDYVSVGLNDNYQRYYLSGYLTLQRTLNEFAFQRLKDKADDEGLEFGLGDPACEVPSIGGFNSWSMPMPTAAYSQNIFFQVVGFLLGLTFAMSLLYPTSRLIKSIVEEKETRMKETLAILGVKEWAHWLAWITSSIIVFTIITILMTAILSSAVLQYSSTAYLFIYFGLFCTSTIGFSFFVAAFFSRAKLAAIVGPMALFVTLLPRWIFFGTNRYENAPGKMLASLLPCTAFAFGADIIADYEYAEQGIHSYNANEGEYSFNTTLGFLFFDTFMYLILAWYLEQVLPRQYGVRRKFYFFLMPSYWFGEHGVFSFVGRCFKKDRGTDDIDSILQDEFDKEGNVEASTSDSRNFQVMTDETFVPRVQIRNLVKKYNNKKNIPPAVNNLNLDMYESQITCLLGHNGAGKTTTISVLTGLFPPTSGDCIIYNNSITKHLAYARRSMGICPQHNVLFENLTVREHLVLFHRIKGVNPTRETITDCAGDVGLGNYIDTAAGALSGGNKRKLSLAIALCGDPKFLLLDEPTSGMDPYSRRATWEMLRTKRAGRVTLLTTHFMDEAELLADRIAVMKKGKLQCCGSALFLKQRFGLGYNLALVIDENRNFPSTGAAEALAVEAIPTDATANKEGLDEKEEVCKDPIVSELCVARPIDTSNIESGDPMNETDRITNFILRFIPGTVLVRKSARELTYRFPQGAEHHFPDLFDALEEQKAILGIGGYGVTNTTLEEVFLQLAEEGDEDEEDENENEDTEKESKHTIETKREDGSMTSSMDSSTVLDGAGVDGSEMKASSTIAGSESQYTESFCDEYTREDPSKVSKPEGKDSQLLSLSEQELTYMGWPSQIGLLYHKRFTILKRDLKGFFFQIILPVLLVACVLIILLLEINVSGSSISLTMDLYRKSPGGTQANTQVLLAGGASLGEQSRAEMDAMALKFEGLEEVLGRGHPHAKFSELPEAATSNKVSEYMLKTFNDHSHDARYGSFVLDDVINFDLDVEWDKIRESVVYKNIIKWLDDGSVSNMNGLSTDTILSILTQLNISVGDVVRLLNLNDASTDDIMELLKILGFDVANPSDLNSILLDEIAQNINIDAIAVDDVVNFLNLTDVTTEDVEEFLNITESVSETIVEIIDQGSISTDDIVEFLDENDITRNEIVEFFNSSITTVDDIIGFSERTDISVAEIVEFFNATINTNVDNNLDFSNPNDITADDIAEFFNLANVTTEEILEFFNLPNTTLDDLPDPTDATTAELVDFFNVTIVSFDDVVGLSNLTGLDTNEVAEFFNLTLTNPDGAIDRISTDDIVEFFNVANVTAEEILDFLNLPNTTLDDLPDPTNTTTAELVDFFNVSIVSFDDIVGFSDLTGLDTNEVVEFFNLTLTNPDGAIDSINTITGDDVIEFFDQFNLTTNEVVDFFNVTLTDADELVGFSELTGVSTDDIVDFFNLTITTADNNIDVSALTNLTLDDIVDSLNNANLTVDDFVDFFNLDDAARDGFVDFLIWANITNDDIIDFTNLANVDIGDLIDFLLPQGDEKYKFNFTTAVSILHNSSSPHAVATFNQAYTEYMYKKCSADPSSRLVSMNHPLPLTTQQGLEVRTTLSIVVSLFILIPYCYIPAAFVVFLVKERVNKSKHLQLVSGVETSAYWIATYLWDMSLFGILTILIMCVFMMFGTESAQVFVGNATSFFCTMSLTFGYGLSAIPYAYLWSRYFTNHSTAQISIMGIFFFTGFVAVNGYFILRTIETTKHVAKGLEPLLLTWPPYVVGDGLIKMSINFFERVILGKNTSPFAWGVCGRNLALLYGLSVPYYGLVLLLEYSADSGSGGIIGRTLRGMRGAWDQFILSRNGVRKTPEGQLLLDDGLDEPTEEFEEDQDVAEERAYVLENKEELKSSAAVFMENLWKIYPPSTGVLGSAMRGIRHLFCFCCRICSRRNTQGSSTSKSSLPKRAVRGLSTAIKNGETFGLLGVNGAGKTTTMGVLTGDVSPTGGEAYVAGYDITGVTPGGVAHARKNIGFCPQVDPLLDLMTARETLVMFGKLRGIPKEHLDDTVNRLLDALTLTPHADKVSQSYSGGNKRKLSLGIALIGNPKVLFIDESSSGMDPGARRKIWDLIAEVSKNRSVILTTHSMEEAEALCTRIAVMISGKMRCLGSVQHLKSTFLDGYTVDIQCSSDASTEAVDAAERYVVEVAVPNAKLAERHGRFLRFDVPSMSRSGKDSVGLGSTFRALQVIKDDASFCVDSYSISQCSLEQVFISLVKADEERTEENLNEE